MRLGYHYHIPCKTKDDKLYTDAQQGVFLDSLAPHFDSILCFMHSPLKHEESNMDYEIKADNISFIDLGPHFSLPKRLLRVSGYMKILSQYENQFDVILCRTPSPLSNFIVKRFTGKSGIYVVGDYIDGLPTMKGNFIKKSLISAWAHYYENEQNRLSKSLLTITNSKLKQDKLLKFNEKTHLIRSTTLSQTDFFLRDDTCLSNTINVLYTGRIDEAKGLEDILEAIIRIRKKGTKIDFHIAGFSLSKNNLLIEKLKTTAKNNQLEGIVKWHGKLKIGSELNSLYRKCDIYCIASRSGFEGFPRTIWEAMANSLPVIASSVGSIPIYIRDNFDGLLIKPRSIDNLEMAISELLENKDKRQLLIKNAYSLALSNTLDQFGIKMSDSIKNYCQNSNQ